MIKKLLLLMTLFLFVAGCAPTGIKQAESDKVLYSVTDATGTKLSFAEKPKRIVSLNVSVDEILLDIVPHERIAALSALADDASLCNAAAKAKSVEGRVNSTNIESVVAQLPDLVIIPDYNATPIDALRSAGLKVFVVKTPNDLKDTLAFIDTIGGAVGEPERGRELLSGMQQRLDSIRQQVVSNVPEHERLRVLGMSFTGVIGMRGTFSDLCYYAGVKNALSGIDVPYDGNVSDEKLLEINPDMIITPSWDYSKKGDPEQFRQRILHDPVYKSIKAVHNGRVVMLHDNLLYATSQYTVGAVEELAQAAYPQLFKK